MLFVDRRRHRARRHGRRHAPARSRARPAPRRIRAGRATRPRSPSPATTISSSCRSTAARSQQLTDVAPKKRDPRETDSQKFIKAEEQKLIEHTRDRGGEEEEGRGEGQGARAAEVRARRSAVGHRSAALARRHARASPRRRARRRRRSVPNVPNYVTESSYTEDIPGAHLRRRRAGQAHAGRHEPRDRQVEPADAAFASGGARPSGDSKHAPREVRWGMPLSPTTARWRSRDARAADNKDRWLRRRRSRDRQDPRRRHAARRCVGSRGWAGSAVQRVGRSAGCRIRSTSGFCPSATAGCISTPWTRRATQPSGDGS